MTGKELYDALSGCLRKEPVPGWAEAELEEAVRPGTTGGKEPAALILRHQAAIMSKSATERRR